MNMAAIERDFNGAGRRRFLMAAPLAAVASAYAAGAVSAGATEIADTPVMQAYRDWAAYRDWLNGPATRGMSNEDFDLLVEGMNGKVSDLVAIPSESDLDVVIKFAVVVEDYQFFANVAGLQPLEDEARALVEGVL